MVSASAWLNDQTAAKGMIVSGKTKISITNRQYPSDLQAEKAILGAILLIGQSPTGDTRHALSTISAMTFEDFFSLHNGIIYLAMQQVNKVGKVDFQSLRTALANAKSGGVDFLTQVGGEAYLTELMNSVRGLDIKTYANQVMTISLRRTLLFNSQRQATLYAESNKSLEDLLLEGQQISRDITRRLTNMSRKTSFAFEDVVQERMKEVEAEVLNPNYVPGITSGIKSLDDAMLMFQCGRGYVFAAPSGWGKTIAMMNFALEAVKAGYKALYITLEMTAKEFTDRAICALADISYRNYQLRTLDDDELSRMRGAYTTVMTMLGEKMLTLVELTHPTMAEIEAKLAEHSLDPGYDIVFIDYLKADKIKTAAQDERNATIEIFEQWEIWKKDTFKHAAHVTATQINRGDTADREDYDMDRLYGSTIIQHIADLVIFIYREDKAAPVEYYSPTTYMEFLIRKGRNVDSEGQVKAILDRKTLALRDIDEVGYENL